MADFEKTIKLLETAMNYNSVGLGRIVVHHDTLSDALELLKSQQAEIERLQPRWIPVSERLPKTGKAVLVCCDDKLQKSMVVAYIDALGLWHPISNDHIAYWMPLPEPPKEGDGE